VAASGHGAIHVGLIQPPARRKALFPGQKRR